MDISTRECFDMGTFRREEFSTRGIFGTGTFRHRDISTHEHFGMVAQVPKCLCQNVHIALQGAKISMCRNVQVLKYPTPKCLWCWKLLMPKISCAEKSPCWNIPVLKCASAETSTGPNGVRAQMFPWWNIRAKMTLTGNLRCQNGGKPPKQLINPFQPIQKNMTQVLRAYCLYRYTVTFVVGMSAVKNVILTLCTKELWHWHIICYAFQNGVVKEFEMVTR